jgi:cyclic-di-AMP phosphodiesterase PgpH
MKASRSGLFFGGIIIVSALLIFSAILIPRLSQMQNASLRVGDVADRDFNAPYVLTYESNLLTEQKRLMAMEAVAPVYTPLDTSVARVQVERLRTAITFITTVREDEYASQKQKLDDLAALEDIQLDRALSEAILSLSDSRWQIVQQEAIRVLEEVMRSTIRSDHIEEARLNTTALVSLTLPENQADIVASLAKMFVAANSIYDDTQTENARLLARDLAEPVMQTFVPGQTIVPRGAVISPVLMEALERFDLVEVQTTVQEITSAVLITILTIAFFYTFFHRNPDFASDRQGLLTFVVLFLLFLYSARLTIPGHIVLPYLFPTMGFAVSVAVLFRNELALVSIMPLSVLIAYDLPNALELTLFYIFCSFFGVLTLRREQRLSSFARSGVSMSFAGAVILLLYRISDPNTDLIGLITLSSAGGVNGILSVFLAIIIQLVASQILGLTSPLQLVELSRPDHPLLQFMLRNAPGSYQHSLQVSNLAEQAAERIGADALLTRVGALYHDCGKALNPLFFIENQVPGFQNPHDELSPEASARIIIQHVTEGMELARKYRLPKPIRSFITEHHGSMFTRYQYVKAVEAAGGDESKVDKKNFRYPGPRPQSRETSLLMLADSCEARLRAGRPTDEDQMRKMIREVFDSIIQLGELNDTNLTLNDLDRITDSFIEALRGVYHPRIEYPTLPSKQAETIQEAKGKIELQKDTKETINAIDK